MPIINDRLYTTGINMLVAAYIEENNPQYVRIVASDFPGNTLINNIIGYNYNDQFLKTIQIDKTIFNNSGEYGDSERYRYLAIDTYTTSNQIESRKIWIQREEVDVYNSDDRLVDTSEYEYVQISNVELNGETGANSVILEGISISGIGEVTLKVEVDTKLYIPGEGSGHDIFEFYAREKN